MQTTIKYGKKLIKIDIKETFKILLPNKVKIKDEDKLIEQALENPIKSKTFDDFFEKLDKLHYQIENELIQLIKSIQNKIKDSSWNDGLLD